MLSVDERWVSTDISGPLFRVHRRNGGYRPIRAKISPQRSTNPKLKTCSSVTTIRCSSRCPWACEGTSASGRKYTAENIESIVEQINTGHLTDKERAHKTPKRPNRVAGAVVKDQDGKTGRSACG
jgi:hypothetical protein